LEVPWGSGARYMFEGPRCKDLLVPNWGFDGRMSLICNG
jgi:hypothetical protein